MRTIMEDELAIVLDDGEERQGSTDMGDVSYRCPAMQIKLDISNKRRIRPHSREFAEATTTTTAEAHKALALGARILGRCALAVFSDEKLRLRLNREFERELASGS